MNLHNKYEKKISLYFNEIARLSMDGQETSSYKILGYAYFRSGC